MKRLISILLILSIMVSTVGCSNSPPKPTLSDPNQSISVENVETENILTETVQTEFITDEIYLEELIVAEGKILELFLEEETINQ